MQLRSRATTLQQYVWTTEQLEAVTLRLMRAEYPLDLRLMGVRHVTMLHFVVDWPCLRSLPRQLVTEQPRQLRRSVCNLVHCWLRAISRRPISIAVMVGEG